MGAEHEIAEPERQAIDDDHFPRPASRRRAAGHIDLLFDEAPTGRAIGSVFGDPFRHFGIARGGGRDQHRRFAGGFRELLCIAALAGTGATEDEKAFDGARRDGFIIHDGGPGGCDDYRITHDMAHFCLRPGKTLEKIVSPSMPP